MVKSLACGYWNEIETEFFRFNQFIRFANFWNKI
jgi:hypothetical protein